MKIVISEKELMTFQNNAGEITKALEQSEASLTFLKLLMNALNPSVPNYDRLMDILEKNEPVAVAVPQLIDSLIKSDELDSYEGLIYSTSELSRYFQVSQTTINKWINQGRFIGVSRDTNKHAKINENVEWMAPNGTMFKVKDVIHQYEVEHMNPPQLTKEEEREEIEIEIEMIKKKYAGNFEKILKNENLSFEEERDLGAYLHFSEMLEKLDEE